MSFSTMLTSCPPSDMYMPSLATKNMAVADTKPHGEIRPCVEGVGKGVYTAVGFRPSTSSNIPSLLNANIRVLNTHPAITGVPGEQTSTWFCGGHASALPG